MPMKNPPHPGRLIKDDIEALGLSVAQAAEGLGEPPERVLKSLMALVDGKPVCVIIPSDPRSRRNGSLPYSAASRRR